MSEKQRRDLQALWESQDLENYVSNSDLKDALDGHISINDLCHIIDHWRAIQVSVWRQNPSESDEWHAQKMRYLTWLASVVRACGGNVYSETFT